MSHLTSGSNGSELFFPGLFILLALLKESLRDFDVLRDQRISFPARSCWLVVFTVTLGTLDRKEKRQYSGNKPEVVEGTHVVDGAIMNIGLASSDERSREDEWVAAGNCRLNSIVMAHIFPHPLPPGSVVPLHGSGFARSRSQLWVDV